jgi:site-specific DNA-methyltransferase (adenine-specific)
VGGGPKLKALQPTQLQQTGQLTERGLRPSGRRDTLPLSSSRIAAAGYLKAKDMCLIPQRLAIALQEDGWWVRSMLPWVKRNGMPESIRDRPASSIEYVIMLTKSARYAYDAKAVCRTASKSTHARVAQNVAAQAGSARAKGGRKTNGPMKAVVRGSTKQNATAESAEAAGASSGRRMSGFNDRWDAASTKPRPKVAKDRSTGIKANESFECVMSGAVLEERNFRNSDLFFDSLEAPYGLISNDDGVPIALDVCPQPFKDAHFATFPPNLVLPLLKAGNPAMRPVLDPFGGAGTVGLVADRLGMDATLIELNRDSVEISDRRVSHDAGLFSEIEVVG